MELGTKARTLELLQGQLHSAQVLPLVITSLLELAQAQEALLARIAELKSEKLIVRSSSKSEDTASTSNAGAFLSLANIPANDTKALLEAIEQVGASMPDPSDEILIQPMLDSIALCGVGFSVDKESNAPYFCISYDTSGDNASVTSGSTNALEHFVQYRGAPCNDPLMARVIAMIQELESIFAHKALDVEFAFVKTGGGELGRVGFPAKNGDRYGDSALITTQGKSLESPCEAPFLARKSHREQLSLESTFSKSPDFKENAYLSSLRDTAPAVAWQSTQTKTQNLESIFENATADTQKADSSNDYSASAELVDCHADKSARNDTKNATSKKVDSRDKNAQSAFDKQAAGGRICDEKAGLCSGEQGDKTCGLSTPRAANSLLFRAKPTPKPSKAESTSPTPEPIELELYCLQVRPLVMQHKQDLYDIITPRALERLSKRIKALSAPHPNVLGAKAIFGVMPDWNPAEIIGLKPKRLALSLYKEIVTDGVWAYQRDNYGYRNLRSHPLMHSFLGIPYIDVRLSFNSFIPKHLDDNIATKLVDYYLSALESTPEAHDKIEFDIVFSCYDFSTPKRLQALLKHGFNDNELKRVEFALLNLTNSILAKDSGLYLKDLAKSQKLEARYSAIVDSSLSLYDKIYWLLEDCKRFGTLPFAGVARAAFVAMQILRSLVEIGFLSTQEKEEFLGSLHTISKQLSDDIAHLQEDSIDEFLAVYGHLRAGSYDILSARYDEGFDYYFGSKCGDSVLGRHSGALSFGLESAIASSRGVDRPQVLSSLRDLQSTDSSSKILPRETMGEQKVDSSPAATPSLRASEMSVAIHTSTQKIATLESTFEKSHDFKENAYFPSLRDTAPAVAWQSTQTKTQNLESSFDKSQKMDCHATATALARNDTKNATSKKVDSRDKNAQSAFDKQAAGGRICDEKAGLCSGEQGDKTCGLSTPRATNSLLFRAKQAKRCERELAGFFRKPTPKPSQAESPQQKPYHISSDRLRALDSLLKEHGLEICAKDLFIFLKQAIEGRESVKFAFSKFLSKALSYIKELGESLQIPASDMAHLDIKSILSLYASLYKDSPKERFLQEIAANKQEYNLTCALKLPALITKPDEVFAFFSSKVVPNFITQKLVIGEAIELDSTTQQNLQGSIVLIKSADPGYDYLFTKDIAGFITCYGGSNSHMAIRASELQIPAVIGVGEHAYQAYASATRIQLDCQAQRIVCL